MVYMEENVYLHLDEIVETVRSHKTFAEQGIHFDIREGGGVKAAVDPLNDRARRYKEYALPFWMLLNLYVIQEKDIIT